MLRQGSLKYLLFVMLVLVPDSKSIIMLCYIMSIVIVCGGKFVIDLDLHWIFFFFSYNRDMGLNFQYDVKICQK